MRTVDEWMNLNDPDLDIRSLVSMVQSDAFHAGRLKGLEDAKSIVTQWSVSETSPCGRAIEQLSNMCESLEKK